MTSQPEEFICKVDPCLSLFNVYSKSTDSLNKRLLQLMDKAAKKVEDIEPVIAFVHQKVADYRQQRPYDRVTVVGSVGNNLYFPEKTTDGSYLVEVDVLYHREMPNIVLPILPISKRPSADIEVLYDRKVPMSALDVAKPPTINVKLDFMKERNLSIGACLLQVTRFSNDYSANAMFLKQIENGNTYLTSASFTCFIPHQKDPSILGEIEIEPLEKVPTLPLYRTYRTNLETLTVCDTNIKYRIIMDKVAAIKVPWPNQLSDFQTRLRKWPVKSLVESIVQDGCLLTHKTSLNLFPLQWKMTFSLSEQKITQNFTFHQRYVYLLFKLVKIKYFDMGIMENGESRIGLTSYHLKTIYLWICETQDPEKFKECPGIAFLTALTSLKQCISSRKCPNYFIPRINTMDRFGRYKKPLTVKDEKWVHDHKWIQAILINKIDSIINAPEKYLNDDLLDIIDKKHIHQLQKTIGVAE